MKPFKKGEEQESDDLFLGPASSFNNTSNISYNYFTAKT